ncbi:hypothetical protein ABW21_db0201769 [Orbilia brochopaga]|nr:hypothetical protein ABW21_db0201769 [Drechslerella brochopaga]
MPSMTSSLASVHKHVYDSSAGGPILAPCIAYHDHIFRRCPEASERSRGTANIMHGVTGQGNRKHVRRSSVMGILPSRSIDLDVYGPTFSCYSNLERSDVRWEELDARLGLSKWNRNVRKTDRMNFKSTHTAHL